MLRPRGICSPEWGVLLPAGLPHHRVAVGWMDSTATQIVEWAGGRQGEDCEPRLLGKGWRSSSSEPKPGCTVCKG